MADYDEYNRLVNQRSDAWRRYNNSQNTIEDCEYKISRLKRTKDALTQLKSSFAEVRKSDERAVRDKRNNWKGQKFDDFQKKGSVMISEDEIFYEGSLDAALDAVNNEITRLENVKYNQFGILGQLSSWINSLSNAIENFFN